jgi:hypothetical protein
VTGDLKRLKVTDSSLTGFPVDEPQCTYYAVLFVLPVQAEYAGGLGRVEDFGNRSDAPLAENLLNHGKGCSR